jgi:hypothetical protein
MAGSIRSIEKSSDLTGNLTRGLPACSTVPQLTTVPRASEFLLVSVLNIFNFRVHMLHLYFKIMLCFSP